MPRTSFFLGFIQTVNEFSVWTHGVGWGGVEVCSALDETSLLFVICVHLVALILCCAGLIMHFVLLTEENKVLPSAVYTIVTCSLVYLICPISTLASPMEDAS